MGVKSAKSRQAKIDLRKKINATERCPHCKKKVQDLEQHLRTEHNLSCARCGKLFGSEVQWKQHMRDRHGLDQKTAVTDDKSKKIEKWVNKDKKDRRAQAGAASEDGVAAMFAEDAADAGAANGMGVELNPFEKAPEPQMHRHICELCSAEHILPVNLAAQGLSFSCNFVGQQCRGSGSSSSMAAPAFGGRWTAGPSAAPAAVAPAFGAAAPVFGAAPPAFPSAPVLFAAPSAAAPAFGVAPGSAPMTAPLAAAVNNLAFGTFGAFGAANGSGGGGGGNDVAVGMAVPSDDEDL